MTVPPAHEWPFLHPLVPSLPPEPCELVVPDVHEAFINHQTASTRLVTTNASYLFQEWLQAIGDRTDVRIIATADMELLSDHAPEVGARRGPFARDFIVVQPADRRTPVAYGALQRAIRAHDPAERLALCVEVLNTWRTAPALLTVASACMEVNDLEAATRDLDEALALAPDWAAAHFESGKLWLRRDDMERASGAFRRATELLPGFTAAWSNLGATVGELDRPAEALAAFDAALALDPENPHALNNVGVVRRELGRLDASEAAFRRVIGLVPERAFGHYNLGHTLFLQGRYHAALSAYVEGQRRDAERNPVQATRLAMCRLATGDAAGALSELRQATASLPRDYRRQLLGDTRAIAWALLTHKPDLAGWKEVNDWLSVQLS
jgi:tetratricopeptide (TPR) repeat protein